MANFIYYDLVFLVAFTLFVIVFLYKRKQKLQRQGLLYLYRTRVGLKFIEWTSKRFGKILNPMQYVVVASGYILMVSMVWFLIKFLQAYLSGPLAGQIKVPPLIPLIPYLPELFKLDFLPPFYFTYWIIIIAIVAITHEFAHGIFARLNNIKVHSTGFGFLGPFLAAFVEPDEKQMEKSKVFPQLSILAAGTFANVLMTILFGLILWGFFAVAFVPAGVNFNSYSTNVVNVSESRIINGTLAIDGINLTKIEWQNKSYYAPSNVADAIDNQLGLFTVLEDAPAINAGLRGAIVEIDGKKIRSYEELRSVILANKPGEVVIIKSISDKEIIESVVKLADKDGKAYLGIGISEPERRGITGWLYRVFSNIKDPFVYYESRIGDIGTFLYDLLWWIVVINISVALVNMLPVGIFDGGRFFYLTILGFTGKAKWAKKAFSASTWIFLAILVLLMVRWFAVIF